MNFKRMNNNYLQVTFRLAVLVGCRLGSTEVPTPSPIIKVKVKSTTTVPVR